jgi:drug/metabolite transporter (DMT)-like permease
MPQYPQKLASQRLLIPFAFACVYIFWGSTYIAIKIGGEHLPALLLAGVRFLISGTLMLIYCRLRSLRLFWNRRQMAWLALFGVLLLGGGNVGLIWAEKFLASGLASLLIAIVPLYVALIEYFLPNGEPLPARGWLGLFIGSVGLFALLWPSIHKGLIGEMQRILAAAALLGGALCWTVGSVISRRVRLPVNAFVAAGWEMLFAGIFNAILATMFGEWRGAQWTPTGVEAIAYLFTFGSLVGFTAYIWLLEHVPVAKVATYAYVNPLVAVALGALILGERLESSEYIGMVSVIFAVFLVTSSRVGKADVSLRQETVAVESDV